MGKRSADNRVIINRHRTSTSSLDSQKSFTFAGVLVEKGLRAFRVDEKLLWWSSSNEPMPIVKTTFIAMILGSAWNRSTGIFFKVKVV